MYHYCNPPTMLYALHVIHHAMHLCTPPHIPYCTCTVGTAIDCICSTYIHWCMCSGALRIVCHTCMLHTLYVIVIHVISLLGVCTHHVGCVACALPSNHPCVPPYTCSTVLCCIYDSRTTNTGHIHGSLVHGCTPCVMCVACNVVYPLTSLYML